MSKQQSPEGLIGRTSFKTHASKVLQESSIGMVSSIAQTSSTRRKIFKALALIICLTGFLWQSGVFLDHVFDYPTIVDVDIVRPNYFNVPGYTFCENNEINRGIFCEKFPDRCEEPSDAFCKEFEYYCGKNKTLVPKKEYYSFSHQKGLEEMIEFNRKLDDLLLPGRAKETAKGPHLRQTYLWEGSYICYSLHDRVNSSSMPMQMPKNTLYKEAIDELTFNIQTEDMFLPGSRAGLLFSIHSPFDAVNPFENGIFMKPGRTYVIYISVEEELLLKEPYGSDCLNYTEIWENNGRSGPRSQSMCRENCFVDISVACYNCILPIFIFPRHENACSSDINFGIECAWDVPEMFKQCQAKCKDDCLKTKYHYTVQERFTASFNEKGSRIKDKDKRIKVDIYFEGDETIIMKHSPKYMTVEVFSAIGGFIGCWLGISLLDIADIFEGFFRIFKHPFKKR